MGIKKYVLVIVLAIPIVFIIISNLKSKEILVQVRYLMLACEKCNHMEVIGSSDIKLISQTIIPESNTYSIEDLISKFTQEKNDLCLEGYAYSLNLSNLWSIDPPGIRFEIEKSYPLSKCKKLHDK